MPAGINPVQAAAIARADAQIAPVMELYKERNRLHVLIYRLPLSDLVRLNELLAKLSDDDLRQVAAFAEGLAAWGSDATQETAK